MKITVGIVTKNRSKQLQRCLLSLTKQTIKPNKILVIDSSFLDISTRQIISHFKDQLSITYIYEKTTGIPYARNKVLEEARGNILAFLDDDCEATPTWLENNLKAHKRHPHVAAIQGWVISMPKGNPVSIISQFNFLDSFAKNFVNKIGLLRIATKNVSFKMNLINRLKLRFDVACKRKEDVDFSKQLLHCNQQIILDRHSMVYHWERSNTKDFLLQCFAGGKARMRVYKKWPREYFPRLKNFWWVNRWVDFIRFCVKNGYGKKLSILLLLFFLHNVTYITPYFFARFQRMSFGLYQHLKQGIINKIL